MKRYEKYKDRGIEWIGEIPAHWEVKKIKYLIEKLETGKRESNPKSNDILSIGGEHINSNGKIEIKNPRYVSQEFYENFKKGKVQKNDILIVKDGATIGKTAFVDFDPEDKMLLNEHVYRVVAHKLYYYFFLSHYFQSSIWKENQSSAQEGITRSTILNIFSFFIPSFHEQSLIAHYLDRKTAQIDELIADKKRLLELYEEEKTAIINQAVTKGINPNVKMKDSGIEWLGEIPEHWEIAKLGWLGKFSASGIDKKTLEGEPLVKMINYTDIYGNKKLTLTTDRKYMIVSCPEEKKVEHQVKIGDLIFTPSSETVDEIGLSAVVIDELPDTVYSYHVIRLRFSKELNLEFKKYLCNNNFVLNQFSKEAKGTTRQIIGRDVFKNIQVIIPPLSEQTAIVEYIDKEIARINAKVEKTKKLIELLEEYKQALISEVVTGKIKVV